MPGRILAIDLDGVNLVPGFFLFPFYDVDMRTGFV